MTSPPQSFYGQTGGRASVYAYLRVGNLYTFGGTFQGQASTTARIYLPGNYAWISLGTWPAGAYQFKTKARSDVTGTPAALTVTITANSPQSLGGAVLATSPLYAAGDTVSASYPAAWASYAALCSFNLNAPTTIIVQWTNPGTYHAAGKHMWLAGGQLHRTG